MAGALFIEAAINNSLERWKKGKEKWMALGGSKNRLSRELYKCLGEQKKNLFEENQKKKNETWFRDGVKSISHPNEKMHSIKILTTQIKKKSIWTRPLENLEHRVFAKSFTVIIY